MKKKKEVKLGKYIHDLLLEHDTVIIPGFGAFISVYKPAEIGESEIKPPSKQISFSDKIRNNDGLLVGYVAGVEQVSHFDALKIIEKERDNIVFLLDKGEEITLEEIGTLYSDEKNEMQFTPVQDENLQTESFGLGAVSLEKLVEEQPEPEINEENQSDEQPVVEEETKVMPGETGDVEVTDQESEPVEYETVKEIDETPKEEINEVSEAVSDSVTEETEPIHGPVETTSETPKSEKEKKKKADWYWYLLILIPIIIAGVFVTKNVYEKKSEATNSKTVIKAPPKNESHTEERQITVPDSAKMVQTEQMKKDSSTTNLEEKTNEEEFAPGEPIYYLVGGSFKDEENAKTYMEELKEKGFEPFYMGKQGNFYMLGIGKYKTEGMAVRARDTIWQKEPDLGLWIMKE